MGAAQDAVPLAESPYLLHPVETGTAGLYKSPVAILVGTLAPHLQAQTRGMIWIADVGSVTAAGYHPV